jgi:uncharacterized protein
MTILIWILAAILVVVGIAGLVLPALPGPLLLFAGLWMAAWAEGFAYVGAKTLIALGLMAALASVADFVAGAFGARHYGASSRSVVGAAVGAVVGIFFGLPGLLLGPFIGALLGELSAAQGPHRRRPCRLGCYAGPGVWYRRQTRARLRDAGLVPHRAVLLTDAGPAIQGLNKPFGPLGIEGRSRVPSRFRQGRDQRNQGVQRFPC